MARYYLLTVSVCAIGFISGCWSTDSDRLPTFSATGSVLVNGNAASGVVLQIVPAPDNTLSASKLRPSALTDDNGKFVFSTYDYGDGAPEGSYKLIAFYPPPKQGSGFSPTGGTSGPADRFEHRYLDPDTSKWSVEIKDQPNDLGTIELESS